MLHPSINFLLIWCSSKKSLVIHDIVLLCRSPPQGNILSPLLLILHPTVVAITMRVNISSNFLMTPFSRLVDTDGIASDEFIAWCNDNILGHNVRPKSLRFPSEFSTMSCKCHPRQGGRNRLFF